MKFKDGIEKKINRYLIYSSLLHDIGKVSGNFQKYIKDSIKEKPSNNDLKDIPTDAEFSRSSKSKSKKFIGPFHNEISYAYIANFINFNNETVEDVICHSVYWHHPANYCEDKNKLLFENAKVIFENINEKEIIEKIHKFVCDLFSSFFTYYDIGYKPDYSGEPKNNIKRIQCPEFFKHKLDTVCDNAYKQLCLNLLLESDRTVSSWSLDELNSFLKSPEIEPNKEKEFSLSENLKNNQKSKQQYDLAQKMSDKKLSVCGVDPAGGKTSIALYWWHHCNNKHPLMITLPRQHQVTGLFQSLKEDSQRVYGNQKIKIEGVFNGQRQDYNWKPKEEDDLLISDINIMVLIDS